MQVKVGIDIIEVNRIKESIDSLGEKFINRIFTPQEIAYCESKKKMRYEHYAVRFAAKEATFKAISSLFPDKYMLSWKNVETINNKEGKPQIEFVSFSAEMEKYLKNVESMDISLSHLKEYAVANVTVLIK